MEIFLLAEPGKRVLMSTFEEVQELVSLNSELSFLGTAATEDLIASAESFLGLSFPDDYVRFLREWGTLSIGPKEFYAIGGSNFENSSIPNGIWFTKIKREAVELPAHLLVLSDNEGDEYFCLDCSERSQSRVVVWSVIDQEVTSIRWTSLWNFILDEVSDFV